MTDSLIHGVGYFGHLAATLAAVIFGSRCINDRQNIWTWILISFGVLLFLLVSVRLSTPPSAFYDFFFAYFPAGQAILHDDHAALRAMTGPAFVNMPVVAYLFAPFALMSPAVAIALFTVMGLGMTFLGWTFLVRLTRLEHPDKVMLGVLFLANGPLVSGIKFGNTSYFIIGALAAGLFLVRLNRPWAAGAVLGVSAILKPPLLLLGLFFILQKDWRGVLSFLLTCAAAAVLSLVIFGLADNIHWLVSCILLFEHGWLVGFTVQSIPAFVYRLSANPGTLTNWLPQTPTLADKLWSDAITALLFVIALLAGIRRSAGAALPGAVLSMRRDLQYLLVLCLCIVSSPLNWSHYYAWFLVPTAFFLKYRPVLPTRERWLGWAAVGLVTPLIAWPASLPNAALMTVYSAWIASHLLFGGLLWFGLIAWWLLRAGGFLWPRCLVDPKPFVSTSASVPSIV